MKTRVVEINVKHANVVIIINALRFMLVLPRHLLRNTNVSNRIIILAGLYPHSIRKLASLYRKCKKGINNSSIFLGLNFSVPKTCCDLVLASTPNITLPYKTDIKGIKDNSKIMIVKQIILKRNLKSNFPLKNESNLNVLNAFITGRTINDMNEKTPGIGCTSKAVKEEISKRIQSRMLFRLAEIMKTDKKTVPSKKILDVQFGTLEVAKLKKVGKKNTASTIDRMAFFPTIFISMSLIIK